MTKEELEKENVELIGKVAFLENDLNNAKAQIEKMKCCENCAFQLVIGGVRDRHCVKCNACSKWELED